jgi:hypothetical protein
MIFNMAKILWEAADWIVTSVFLNKTKVRHYIENDRTLSAYFVTIEFIYVIKLTENVNRQKKKFLIKH